MQKMLREECYLSRQGQHKKTRTENKKEQFNIDIDKQTKKDLLAVKQSLENAKNDHVSMRETIRFVLWHTQKVFCKYDGIDVAEALTDFLNERGR